MKVLFYPDPPVQINGHSLSKTIMLFQMAGFQLTNDIHSDWDVGVYWNYNDVSIPPVKLEYSGKKVLNIRCIDIRKSTVDRAFDEIFGYTSLANTDTFGYCVRKTERQSAHDGEIIRTPCKHEKGFVYQKLLDNRIAINRVCDIRIPVIVGEIPFIIRKSYTVEGTFENTLSKDRRYWVESVDENLTENEVIQIKRFCIRIGLDIGELDVIRDNSTGLIYIIDVNNIPGSNVFQFLDNGMAVAKELSNLLKSKLCKI